MGWVSWERFRDKWLPRRDSVEEPEPERIPAPLPVAHVNAAWARSTLSLLTPDEEETRRRFAARLAQEQSEHNRKLQTSMLCACWPECVASGRVVLDEGGPVVQGRRDPKTGRPLEMEETR